MGADIEVPPLPLDVTPEVQRNLERLGFKLRFIPKLEIGALADLLSDGEKKLLEEIQSRYPNWRRYMTLSEEEEKNPSVMRNLNERFWKLAKEIKMQFPQLPGTWVAVETMPKPSSGNSYKETLVGQILGLEDRFNVSWNEVYKLIKTHKSKLLDEIGLSTSDIVVRMLEAIEFNLLANREGWGKTNTSEWTNTRAHDYSVPIRIIVGDSNLGGAANAGWFLPAVSDEKIGFRLAIVFGT